MDAAGRPWLMALVGVGLLAAVFLLPDLLPEESELVPPPDPPPLEELRDPAPLVPEVEPEAPAEPELAEAEPARPAEPLPPLEASDGWVRVEASGLSKRPAFEEWLLADDLIRRFVASVDEIAIGNSPRRAPPLPAARRGRSGPPTAGGSS